MGETRKKSIEGLALSLSFLITSIILYVVPDFIGHQLITRSIGVVLGIIGVMGFILELSKVSSNSNEEIKNARRELGVAIFLGVLIFILLYFFTNWFIHLIVTFLILLSLYGGIKSIITIIVLTDFSKRKVLHKIPVIVLNMAIFTLTILQLLQIFKVIEK